ncbi:hypothetical protein Gpo141_00007924 [Globisporangium polare]
MKPHFSAVLLAVPALLLVTSDADTQAQPLVRPPPSSHENVWTPEFPAIKATAKGSTTIPLFGNVSSHSLFSLYGHVALGTPPQRFKLLFETSESALWIPNFQASSSKQHAFYNHSQSSSYERNGAGYMSDASYYAFYGFLSRDTVCVGDFTVSNVSFVEATQVTDPSDFADLEVDGIFGLAPELERNHVLRRLMGSDGGLNESVFAFYLNKNSSEIRGTQAGELTIGAADGRRYTGEIRYVEAASNQWVVELDAVTVGGHNLSLTSQGLETNSEHALVAPSWPFIAGPGAAIRQLAKAVGVDGSAIDCDSHGPDIEIRIGGRALALTKSEYTRRVEGTTRCRWIFQETDLELWWLGQPFLQKFYTVFELGSEEKAPRVGFALAA